MHRTLCTLFAMLATVVYVGESVCGGDDQMTQELSRLRASGIKPHVFDQDGVAHCFSIPPDWHGTDEDLDALLAYCQTHNRKATITFYGPAATERRLKKFEETFSNASIRHEIAVELGVVWLHHDEDRVELESVRPNSPGGIAGVRQGDVILGVGEYRWPESDMRDSLQYALKKQIPGQRTTITVKRADEVLTLPIVW